MLLSRSLRAVFLLGLAGLAAFVWLLLSFFLGANSASADEPSPLDPLGSLVGSVSTPLVAPLADVAAPVVSAPVQAVAPVVQAVAPVAAQATATVVSAPVVAPVAAAAAPVVAPVTTVVSHVTTPVVTSVATAIAPVAAPLEPVVSAVVAPLAPAVSQIVAPIAPIVSEIAGPVVGGAVGVGIASQISRTDVAANAATQTEVTQLTPQQRAVASVYLDAAITSRATVTSHETTSLASSATATPVGAPGLPVDGPLPAAPTALSGSAVGSAAGGLLASGDVARNFALVASAGASVTSVSDDELPSSPTFPSDTTPD